MAAFDRVTTDGRLALTPGKNNFGRHAERDGVRGHLAGNDTVDADDGARADVAAVQDHRSGTDEDVIADTNAFVGEALIYDQTIFPTVLAGRAHDRHLRSDAHVIANDHVSLIGGQVIEAADGAVLANDDATFAAGLQDGERFDDRTPADPDAFRKLHPGGGVYGAAEPQGVVERRHK